MCEQKILRIAGLSSLGIHSGQTVDYGIFIYTHLASSPLKISPFKITPIIRISDGFWKQSCLSGSSRRLFFELLQSSPNNLEKLWGFTRNNTCGIPVGDETKFLSHRKSSNNNYRILKFSSSANIIVFNDRIILKRF